MRKKACLVEKKCANINSSTNDISEDLRREIKRAGCQTCLYFKVFYNISGVSRGGESMQDAHDLHKAA